MKKDISLFCTKIIYSLFIIGTIISSYIVYKNIDNTFAVGFVIAYAILAFLFVMYIIYMTVLNLRRLKWGQIKGRLLKFIISFMIFSILGYIFDRIFRSSNVDLFRELSIAFGLAFGASFTDVIFKRRSI